MGFRSSGFNLSMKLHKNIWLKESKDKNLVFSSFSIHTALGLLASGSKGETLDQLLEFLNFKTLSELNSATSQVTDSLTSISTVNDEQPGGPKLTSANSVWLDESCTLKPSYSEIATSTYKAEAKVVDFKTKADKVEVEVNQWVENKTNGLIKDLIQPGSFGASLRVVLVNALYFKGSWLEAFDVSKTKDSDFYLPDGSSIVQVPYMTSDDWQRVGCYEGFKILELPYCTRQEANYTRHETNYSEDDVDSFSEQRDDDVSADTRLYMYIILPDDRDGLSGLMEKVSSDPDGFLHSHILPYQPLVRMGEFRIPKLKFSFDFEASEVLKELGLVLPFNPCKSELTEMVTTSSGGNIFVSKVVHKCFIEVEEEGTTAAAATAIYDSEDADGSDSEDELPEPVDFVADHPFMFLIGDPKSGAVLFAGHVLNPLLTYE